MFLRPSAAGEDPDSVEENGPGIIHTEWDLVHIPVVLVLSRLYATVRLALLMIVALDDIPKFFRPQF
jgi:hypothetical protein